MNKKKLLTTIILLTMLVSPIMSQEILGTWKCIGSVDVVEGKKILDYMKGQYLTVNADGTYSSTSEEMGYGRFTLQGNSFTAKNNNGASFTATLSISGSQLTMVGTASYGASFSYVFEKLDESPRPLGPVDISNIYYSLDYDNNTAEVYESPDKYSGDVIIPSSIQYDKTTFNVTSIKDYAYSNNSSLGSITIPNSVTNIGEYAFSFCSNLTSITIPNGVTSLLRGTFHSSGLTSINLGSGLTNIGNYVFKKCIGLKSIRIPSNVTSIGLCSFEECTGLVSITIDNGLTNIGPSAFLNCTSLTSLTIPSSVIRIGSYAFGGCSSLSSLMVEAGNPKYDSRNNCNAIIDSESNKLILGCKNTIIPSNVTSIGEGAFDGCKRLSSITIPENVINIEQAAFRGVEIQQIVSLIEEPFEIVGISSLLQTFSENTFNNATLYVPLGAIDKYKAMYGWKDFNNIVEFDPSGIKRVAFCDKEEIYSFDVNGKRLNKPQKGLNIIRMNEGSTRKVIIK